MNSDGIDTQAFLHQLAGRLDQLQSRDELNAALDDVEYLLDAMDPEMQEPACRLAELLRQKLDRTGR